MLVICDFDGTITQDDVTNVLLDHYTGREWRDLLEPYRAGEISHLDIMRNSYRFLKTPAEELLDFARRNIRVRPNFKSLLKLCRERDWPFAVVSGGIDFYLKDFLDEGIDYYCYLGEYKESWQVRMPDWPVVDLAAGHDFKVRVVEELKLKYPGREVVYLGDGANDWPAGSQAQKLFTVAGSRLSKLSAEAGKAHVDFTDFGQVVEILNNSELVEILSVPGKKEDNGK